MVLAVAAVLLTMGVPAMTHFIKSNRLKGEAYDLLGEIQFARSEAARRRVRVILCRSPNPQADPPQCGGTDNTWTTGWLVFASGDTNNTYEDGTDTLLRRAGPAPGKVTVITNSTSNRNLEYNPDGTTNESGGTARFAVCDDRGGGYGRQFNVPPHGRPRVVKGTSGSPVDCTSPS